MEIKTKFNVGDKVYINDYFHQKDKRWTTIRARITCIKIVVFEEEMLVRYCIDKINEDMEFQEQSFYTTRKEAVKRCYELNTGRVR